MGKLKVMKNVKTLKGALNCGGEVIDGDVNRIDYDSLDEARKSGEWIDVNDAVPPYGNLMTSSHTQICLTKDGRIIEDEYYFKSEDWGEEIEITHWKPIPGTKSMWESFEDYVEKLK